MAEGENRNRVVALDVGTVRIGVAASDPTGTFAQGVTVLAASEGWQDELAGIVLRYRASKLLVGMPRRTGGDEGPEAVQMRRVAALLSERFEGLEI
ncbi:MAG: Holliday junction resolvase RuvX, partial [Synergistaceae bacterium]|nr:Holliday junction resolvase RuvX [Synergistaceae bacterium]